MKLEEREGVPAREEASEDAHGNADMDDVAGARDTTMTTTTMVGVQLRSTGTNVPEAQCKGVIKWH